MKSFNILFQNLFVLISFLIFKAITLQFELSSLIYSNILINGHNLRSLSSPTLLKTLNTDRILKKNTQKSQVKVSHYHA